MPRRSSGPRLSYAGRYATTRARLAAYLGRKLRERGWDGEGEPPVAELVARMAALGYVDDRAFAAARAAALSRRGYGARRVGAALRGAGIGEEDGAEARELAAAAAWEAALRFAERRRIGPFAAGRGRSAGAGKGVRGDAARRPSSGDRAAPGLRAARPSPAKRTANEQTWFTKVESMIAWLPDRGGSGVNDVA